MYCFGDPQVHKVTNSLFAFELGEFCGSSGCLFVSTYALGIPSYQGGIYDCKPVQALYFLKIDFVVLSFGAWYWDELRRCFSHAGLSD